jgi:hypothetical protein
MSFVSAPVARKCRHFSLVNNLLQSKVRHCHTRPKLASEAYSLRFDPSTPPCNMPLFDTLISLGSIESHGSVTNVYDVAAESGSVSINAVHFKARAPKPEPGSAAAHALRALSKVGARDHPSGVEARRVLGKIGAPACDPKQNTYVTKDEAARAGWTDCGTICSNPIYNGGVYRNKVSKTQGGCYTYKCCDVEHS